MMNIEVLYDRLFAFGKKGLTCYRNEEKDIFQITWIDDNLMYNISKNEEAGWVLKIQPEATFKSWQKADIEVIYENLEDMYFDIEGPLTWIYRRLAHKYISQCKEWIDLGY